MRRWLSISFLWVASVSQAVAPNSLATTFVDVVIPPVGLGETVALHDGAGRNFILLNGSDRALRVEIIPELPRAGECRSYAKPIPDVSWLSVEPRVLEIPANDHREAQLTLRVPNERRYRGKTYQAMVRAARLPDPADKSIQIIQALRVRVIFTIKAK